MLFAMHTAAFSVADQSDSSIPSARLHLEIAEDICPEISVEKREH